VIERKMKMDGWMDGYWIWIHGIFSIPGVPHSLKESSGWRDDDVRSITTVAVSCFPLWIFHSY